MISDDESPESTKSEDMVCAFSRINTRMNEAFKRDFVTLRVMDVYLVLELVASMAGEIEFLRTELKDRTGA